MTTDECRSTRAVPAWGAAVFATLMATMTTAEALAYDTSWVTGASLMAGRGFYPNGTTYGQTGSLDPNGSAWCSGGGTHTLTWVADIPTSATYYLWARRYMGYGGTSAQLDDVSVPANGTRTVYNSRAEYGWVEVSHIAIDQGIHHVDVAVSGMLDALLLTSDPNLLPALDGSNLSPFRIVNPVLRAQRTYRTDESGLTGPAGARGYVVASLPSLYGEPYDMPNNDYLPGPTQVLSQLALWSSRAQYASVTFAVRALTQADALNVSIGTLTGPHGATIGPADLDMRVVGLMHRPVGAFVTENVDQLWPELLLRNDSVTVPQVGSQGGFGNASCTCNLAAHESRQFWLTVHVPSTAVAGSYNGYISLTVTGDSSRTLTLPVSLTVRPINLRTVEGNYGIFLPATSSQADMGAARLLEVLRDHVRHGVNSVTLYGGYGDLTYAHQAGMTGGVATNMLPIENFSGMQTNDPQYPPTQVAQAQAWGFRDLAFWAGDEPLGPTAIATVLYRAQLAKTFPVRSVASLNDPSAADQLKDFIDYPIYAMAPWSYYTAADGGFNAYPKYSRDRGFVPASYWTTWQSDPLYYRAFVGLFNSRVGYQGAVPWLFGQMDTTTAYAPDTWNLSYPDKDNLPISSIRWEAYKDGIDDVRYLQELDRLILAGQTRQNQPSPPTALASAISNAQTVRAAEFDAIGGTTTIRYFDYLNSLPSGKLDTSRAAFADAIVQLNSPMASGFARDVAPGGKATGMLLCTDLDGDSISYSRVTNPAKGTVAIDTMTGAYTYVAHSTATGTDTFSYRCSAGGVDSTPAIVTINIQDVTSSLTGRWNFENNPSDTAPGTPNNGSLASNMTYNSSDKKVGTRSLNFVDTLKQYMSVASQTDLNPTGNFTWCSWIKATDFVGNRRVLQKGGDGAQYRMFYDYQETGTNMLVFQARIGGVVRSISVVPPSSGDWHHIAATYDGSALKFYVDGGQRASANASGTVATTSGPLYVGAKAAGDPTVGDYWSGTIDDLRLYSGRALSQGQILAVMTVTQ